MDYKATFDDGYELYFLQHFGRKGMHWGIRRYQNEDGTLTEEGREHYRKIASKPKTTAQSPNGIFDIKGRIRYRMQRKANAKYRDAAAKLIEDDKRDFGKDDAIIRQYAKAHALSLDKAKKHYDYVMEDYNHVKDSDVVKKYPHDYKTYGHPMQAGGYWSHALQEDIEAKSGSWYFGEAVSPGFKKAMAQYHKILDNAPKVQSFEESRARNKKAHDVVLNAVLKDLGLPINEKNRDALEPIVFWD